LPSVVVEGRHRKCGVVTRAHAPSSGKVHGSGRQMGCVEDATLLLDICSFRRRQTP
jgi:hypothetical protein